MPKIVFVNPLTLPIDLIEEILASRTAGISSLAQEGVSLPMGIMYLSSYIKKHIPTTEVGLIDYRIEYNRLKQYSNLEIFIRELADRIVTSPPDILAFSLVVSSSHAFFRLALDVLKKMWPSTTVIVGGFHATNFTTELLKIPQVDYVFRGEAEYALREFLDAWPHLSGLHIQGVVPRADRFANPQAQCKPLVSMDDNPMPDYGLTDMARYVSSNTRMVIKTGDKAQRSANIMTSLGCPFICTFCSSRTVHGRKMRYKAIEHVVAEVKYLYEEHGVTLIMPEDDLFTANKKRTLSLLEALRGLKIPNFRMQFPVALSVNTLTYEIIDSLIASGMDVASLAIESGSVETQNRIIKKNVDLEKAREWVRYLRCKEIPIRTSFILGFPGETLEMMMESIEYARTLGADWYDFFIATPLAGSEMCQEFLDMGYMPNDIDVISRGYYSRRNFDTPEISANDLSDLVYRANLLCNFKYNVNLQKGKWEQAIKLFTPIVQKYPFHIIAQDCLRRCHEALGDDVAAEACCESISRSVRRDERALMMLTKYGDLLSESARVASTRGFVADEGMARQSA